jgi:hypothetical protein
MTDAGARSVAVVDGMRSGVPMSSVVVGWTGRCADARARARLVAHLTRLAELSDSYLRRPAPELQIVANGAVKRDGRRRRPRANVEHVSRAISGEILISSGIVSDQNAFLATLREAKLPAIDHPEIEHASMTSLSHARLSGIDFRLFGAGQLQPGADRLSFVFLETDAAPFLNGRLVQVEGEADCREHDADMIRAATAYLSGPKAHLHLSLEDWIDLLFSWVKFFFVGDLWWRRFEEMQTYEDYRAVFADVQQTLGGERAEQATFDAILATYAQHAEHLRGTVVAAG